MKFLSMLKSDKKWACRGSVTNGLDSHDIKYSETGCALIETGNMGDELNFCPISKKAKVLYINRSKSNKIGPSGEISL